MQDRLIRGRYNSVAQTIADGELGDVALDADGAVHISDGGNSITIDGTVTASGAAGDVAHDAVDSGNPVKIGGKVVDMDGSDPGTIVSTQGDRANLACDAYGRMLVNKAHPNSWSVPATYTGAQTNTQIKAAPGANLALYITDIVVSNGATIGNIKFVENTASAADKIAPLYFGVNGGTTIHFTTPIQLTVNKDFGITSVNCTTHAVTVNGYTARPTL